MRRRQQLESIMAALENYEGPQSYNLRFLIEVVCDLQIALDEITRAETLTRAQAIANKALEREPNNGGNHGGITQ